MSENEGTRRRGAAPYLLLALLFVGAAVLFAQLLRPLATTPATGPAVQPVARAELPSAPIVTPAEPPARPVVVAAAETPAPEPVMAYRPDFQGPRVAIILTDVGDNPAHARAAIAALPPTIGLAFTPYPDVRALTRLARTDGHEIWIGVPMQPKAWPRVSPGKNTLLVGASAATNVRGLDWALARVEGAVGITGMMGSAFTENERALRPILEEVGRRSLVYVDARASARSVGFATARAIGTRAAVNDRFLDESGTITGNLAALEQQAKLEGSAIGFARPLPATVAALDAWAATLEGKGILLVPPTSLAQ